MAILVYEDGGVNQLAPITTARAACSINVGSYTLVGILQELGLPIAATVRDHLAQIYALDFPDIQPSHHVKGSAGPSILLNARAIPSVATLEAVRRLVALADGSQTGVVKFGDQIAAVLNPGVNWDTSMAALANDHAASFAGLPELDVPLELFTYPHDVIAANMKHISGSLEHRIAGGNYHQFKDGVFVNGQADVGDFVITDTSSGPIVIEDGASIGPYTLLRGPIHIGRGCRILEHAAIKDEVALGHTTKIGGEVEAAVVEPFTNKQHHGFLGHSYLGSWINLGAGTCNSDLKNTYGKVNMEYSTEKMATGMQFLGCVMGDYSKTAINTGIFTGKVIGVCSMMYGFVTSNVPSFVNYARLFGQLATLPAEVMIATQQRMFSRRKVEQRECDKQLMHDMYRLTQAERDRFGDEIVF